MQAAKKNAPRNSQVTAKLNQSLASTLDLKLQVKQAHWNVKGENFSALHELFDKIAADVDEYADLMAERAVQLGGVAEGTLQAISKATDLGAFPVAQKSAQDYVNGIAQALRNVADNTRQGIDFADEQDDKVTADLFTEVARGLDKWRWMVEASRK